jgi:hypothetical protein
VLLPVVPDAVPSVVVPEVVVPAVEDVPVEICLVTRMIVPVRRFAK